MLFSMLGRDGYEMCGEIVATVNKKKWTLHLFTTTFADLIKSIGFSGEQELHDTLLRDYGLETEIISGWAGIYFRGKNDAMKFLEVISKFCIGDLFE